MHRSIKGFLALLRLAGSILLYGLGLVVLAFAVALIIGLCFLGAPTFFSQIVIIGVMAVLAVVFLAGVDGIRHRIALRRYLSSLPMVDARNYCKAYPEYDRDFLLEVRQRIAAHFRIDPDKVSPEMDMSPSSPLNIHSLLGALFHHFRPAASPELQRPTPKTARHPRPAHVVDFPVDGVSTLRDLLREIDRLRHRDPAAPDPDAILIEPASAFSSRLGTGSLTISTAKISPDEDAYLKSRAKSNPVSRWISRVIFSDDDGPLQADIDGGVVEICVVTVERVAVGIPGGNEGPILFLDLGYHVILALNGPWMFKPQLFKVPERTFLQWDAENSFFKAFYLRRAPRTGLVLGLKVTDETLIQSERSIPRDAIFPFGESRFLEGSLDTLENDLKVPAKPS